MKLTVPGIVGAVNPLNKAMNHTVPDIVGAVNPLTRSPTVGRLSFPVPLHCVPLQIRNLEDAALNLGSLSAWPNFPCRRLRV